MINLLKSLNKKIEENNKKNTKTQAITNKLLAAYKKMSHCIDSVLLRMESLEKKVAHQEKLIVNNTNHKRQKVNKILKDFIEAIISNKKNNNNNKENTVNHINKPQDTHTQH
ncbi:hypothetical protein O181_027825 [Austropuccinia psidii MF-1]|uniref:Uncharacterized protein n=1 Tax=Austropuccinia psidii MF-1 TaxID=1389203 RepID=A0A9Q3H3K2_9BASI|nr:hypothetical protein [Austropuccinia psidii MF-1]